MAVFRRDFDAGIASIVRRLAQAVDPVERIEIWIDSYLDWCLAEGQQSRRSVLTAGPVTRAAGYFDAVRDCRHQIAQVLAESIADATELGRASSAQPMLDALSIRAIIDGMCESIESFASSQCDVKAYVKRFAWPALGLAAEAGHLQT